MNTLVRENRDSELRQHEHFVAPVASIIEDGREQRADDYRTPFPSRRRRHADPSRIAPRKSSPRFRARSIDRRRQDQRKDRSGRRDFDSAQSRAGQATENQSFLIDEFLLAIEAADRRFAASSFSCGCRRAFVLGEL